jgi:NADH:ubiquinone oxidoreductase subunit 3 (subunit A)
MYQSNPIKVLGVFAALALFFFFLLRVAGPAAETSAAKTAAYEAGPGPSRRLPNPVIIKSWPADTLVIEALPPR